MNRRAFSLIIILLLIKWTVSAQTGVFELLNKDLYKSKVKLVDEFISRFNGEELRTDQGSDYSDRKSSILLLFDGAKFKSKSDSSFIEAEKFANYIVESGIKLNFSDKDWYAKINCHGKLYKKPVTFGMTLCVEERGNDMYKWVISDVESDLFLTSRDKPHKELFIMPNDNEQFFQSVRKTTTETYKFIDDYVRKNYKADALSVFLTLVRSNQLKIDAITDVEFFFLQVPGYLFKVKNFGRETKNSGWLIDSLSKLEPSIGEFVVKRFGESLSLWCRTDNIYYRNKVIDECAAGCHVNNGLMLKFAETGLAPFDLNSYTINSYLNCIENEMPKGLKVAISDIECIQPNGDFEVVSCKTKISGHSNFCSKDLFYVRKQDGKIMKIAPYSTIVSTEKASLNIN